MHETQVTVEQLLIMIGEREVQIYLLRGQIAKLTAQLATSPAAELGQVKAPNGTV